jgi:saccharopine dehydrogenase-like NADP-dependent oxidoreductase
MEEYTRPARVVMNGEIVEVDPLGEIFPLEIPGLGPLEEFRSDGLRTLLHTVRAQNLEERTIRYRGHLERMRILRDMGFLEREHVEHTLNVLAPHLRRGAERDLLVMEVIGRRGDQEMQYFLLDRHSGGVTAMARTTGYTATAVARWLLRGNVDTGVVPPERLGMDENAYRFMLDELSRRNVRVEERIKI